MDAKFLFEGVLWPPVEHETERISCKNIYNNHSTDLKNRRIRYETGEHHLQGFLFKNFADIPLTKTNKVTIFFTGSNAKSGTLPPFFFPP